MARTAHRDAESGAHAGDYDNAEHEFMALGPSVERRQQQLGHSERPDREADRRDGKRHHARGNGGSAIGAANECVNPDAVDAIDRKHAEPRRRNDPRPTQIAPLGIPYQTERALFVGGLFVR